MQEVIRQEWLKRQQLGTQTGTRQYLGGMEYSVRYVTSRSGYIVPTQEGPPSTCQQLL